MRATPKGGPPPTAADLRRARARKVRRHVVRARRHLAWMLGVCPSEVYPDAIEVFEALEEVERLALAILRDTKRARPKPAPKLEPKNEG